MEITEKQKKTIGVVVGCIGVAGVITAVGYYYLRPKNELGFDENESDKLRGRGLDPYDELGYDNIEQIRLPKLTGDSRWRDIDSKYEDLNNHDNRMLRRDRFTVFNRGGVIEKRFKVLKTHGNGTGRAGRRLRVSGDLYKKTPSGYNQNNRNATLKDLDIF